MLSIRFNNESHLSKKEEKIIDENPVDVESSLIVWKNYYEMIRAVSFEIEKRRVWVQCIIFRKFSFDNFR